MTDQPDSNTGAADVVREPEIDIPDIPEIPEPQSSDVEDDFSSGFRFAFIGSGQGGSRIAECFNKLGYQRCAVINTADTDLATINIPDKNKLKIGDKSGAGKDRQYAAEVFDKQKEDVIDLMRNSFGKKLDRVFVSVSAGGGTGAGTFEGLVTAAADFQRSIKATSPRVGAIVALPKISEGKKVNANAVQTLEAACNFVESGVISPLIILDNEKINTLYPDLSVGKFWGVANSSICSLFHLFNTICIRNSEFSSFDNKDLGTVLDSGIIVFGATQVSNWSDGTNIAKAIRGNLKNNILCGDLDLSTGSVGAAVILASKDALDEIPMSDLDNGFDQLNRLMKPNSMLHNGIYSGNTDKLKIFTCLGGFNAPKTKIDALKELAV